MKIKRRQCFTSAHFRSMPLLGAALSGASLLVFLSPSADAQRLWGHSVGGAQYSSLGNTNVLVESDHNIVLTGDLGSYGIQPDGQPGQETFIKIVSFDSQGNLLWDHRKQVTPNSSSLSAIDSNGDIVVVAINRSTQNEEYFKFSPTGQLLIETTFTIAPGQATNYYTVSLITGRDGSITLLDDVVDYSSRYVPSYGVVVRLSSTGEVLWSKQLPEQQPQIANIVAGALDSDGDLDILASHYVIVADQFEQLLDLLKYDSSGNLIFDKPLARPYANTDPGGLVLDSSDNIYITGGGYSITPDKQYQNLIFTAKFDSSGAQLWQRSTASRVTAAPLYFSANQIALDSEGNVIVGGDTETSPNASTPPYSSTGTTSLFKYSTDGLHLWTVKTKTKSSFTNYSVALFTTPSDNIILDSLFQPSIHTSDSPQVADLLISTALTPSGSILGVNATFGVNDPDGYVFGEAAAYDPAIDQYYVSASEFAGAGGEEARDFVVAYKAPR